MAVTSFERFETKALWLKIGEFVAEVKSLYGESELPILQQQFIFP